ncbi:MAG: hypothetical protein SH856_02110 [Flavobacteriales bacterium]|nr:hypothetical protein [Flavobacteriales bacterium]
MPQPRTNASASDNESPLYMLKKSDERLIGCASNNSMNSLLL